MSVIEECCFLNEDFVSSNEDIFLSSTPISVFTDIGNVIDIIDYDSEILYLNYSLVLKDILDIGYRKNKEKEIIKLKYDIVLKEIKEIFLLKKIKEYESKLCDYELGYSVWKSLVD